MSVQYYQEMRDALPVADGTHHRLGLRGYSLGAYAGEDFEQVLARVYFALALIQAGDYGNAYAILRQAEELQQGLRERYDRCCATSDFHLPDLTFAKYLFALLLEKQGDKSNACLLYQQSGALPTPGDCSDRKQATVLVLNLTFLLN